RRGAGPRRRRQPEPPGPRADREVPPAPSPAGDARPRCPPLRRARRGRRRRPPTGPRLSTALGYTEFTGLRHLRFRRAVALPRWIPASHVGPDQRFRGAGIPGVARGVTHFRVTRLALTTPD